MKAKLIVGLAIFMMVLSMASVSAQYPTVVTGGASPSPLPPGPTPITGNKYSFIVDTPLGTFQSVQVVIDGLAYDLVYENGAWRGEFPARPGQTYFYRITTRAGVSFESNQRRL